MDRGYTARCQDLAESGSTVPRSIENLRRRLCKLAPDWRACEGGLLARADLSVGTGEPTQWSGWHVETVARRTPFKVTQLIRDPRGRGYYLKSHFGQRPRKTFRRAALAAWWEALFALELAAAGFDVPRPAAVGGEGACSWVLIEALEPHRTLEDDARDRSRDLAMHTREAARILARLHASGHCHRDYYACHLLHDGRGGPLFLIDLERVWRPGVPRGRAFVKDAAQFLHSVATACSRRQCLRFLVTYGRSRHLTRAARKRFAAAALRKQRRIARHVPRHDHPLEVAP